MQLIEDQASLILANPSAVTTMSTLEINYGIVILAVDDAKVNGEPSSSHPLYLEAFNLAKGRLLKPC